jgi:hypothetical protein
MSKDTQPDDASVEDNCTDPGSARRFVPGSSRDLVAARAGGDIVAECHGSGPARARRRGTSGAAAGNGLGRARQRQGGRRRWSSRRPFVVEHKPVTR